MFDGVRDERITPDILLMRERRLKVFQESGFFHRHQTSDQQLL